MSNQSRHETARRVDGWATVLQDLRDYLSYLQVHSDSTTLDEIARIQACIITLDKVWDRVQI